MKLDTKQKLERVSHFFCELKQEQGIELFLYLEDIPRYGIYDFCYINRQFMSFGIIEKKLKDSHYTYLMQFIKDIRYIFQSVSDYAFDDDEIQDICSAFNSKIDKFYENFVEELSFVIEQSLETENSSVIAQKTNEPSEKQQQNSSFNIKADAEKQEICEKLQMISYLQKFQNNVSALRFLTSHYGIGTQVKGDQFIVQVDIESEFWTKFAKHQKRHGDDF